MLIETSKTERHQFYIEQGYGLHTDVFVADFRPLNPKTGKPWQASHRIVHGADVQIAGYDRPIAFSTVELARAAVAWKQQQL